MDSGLLVLLNQCKTAIKHSILYVLRMPILLNAVFINTVTALSHL